MVKIKEVSNEQLKEYLIAYQEILSLDPHAEGVSEKVDAIRKALHNRDLLGIKVGSKNAITPLNKLKNIFKKKK
ncbi:MAG: hypothetical protein ACJAS4_000536 [Bacteriovoracaceae bacterium]|jgi:hypothetical protein